MLFFALFYAIIFFILLSHKKDEIIRRIAMNMKKHLIPLASIVFISSVFYGCSPKNEVPKDKTETVLGTVCTVKLYDHIDDKIFDKVFDRFEDIENKMTINREASEIIKVNEASGKEYVKVSKDTFEVIKKGLYYSRVYDKFDITIGPLVKLWNISFDNAAKAQIPKDSEIEEKLKLVNQENILIDEANQAVMLKEKGMILDLGGIAKGYAADEAIKILKENGVQHAIVNLGGNVMTLGSKPDGSPWTIAVQHPFSKRGASVGTVKVTNKTVVTSGIYERYIKSGDKIYHHIIDTSTGYPVDNNLLSVTIVTDKSVNGDGLSKIFALGVDKGKEFLKTVKDAEAIFITKDNKIYITPGLKGIFNLTDSSFELVE
jgi:thiamine biosynthesis lipoprotein